MDTASVTEPTPVKSRATVERTSERELVVTRTINGPARLVFKAWTTPELFRQWWVPKSLGMNLLSCDMDVRVGGTYRLQFAYGDEEAAFFGTYTEVAPPRASPGPMRKVTRRSLTTVTFAETGGKTLLAMQRAVSLEGSARRRRHRGGGCDGRVVRPAGRASRHPARAKGGHDLGRLSARFVRRVRPPTRRATHTGRRANARLGCRERSGYGVLPAGGFVRGFVAA